jgi:hypothetical protein
MSVRVGSSGSAANSNFLTGYFLPVALFFFIGSPQQTKSKVAQPQSWSTVTKSPQSLQANWDPTRELVFGAGFDAALTALAGFAAFAGLAAFTALAGFAAFTAFFGAAICLFLLC